MTPGHNCFKAIAFFLLFAFQTSFLRAQKELLDKPVHLKADRQELKKVLDQLSQEGNFSFAYRSDILRKDKLITITIRESALREVLAQILGDGFDFRETDGFVLIRKKGTAKQARKKIEYPATRTVASVRKVALKKPTFRSDSLSLEKEKETMRHIIADLLKEQIIADKDSLVWFGLDNTQFVVNDKVQPASLHTLFKSRYIGPDGKGYYFGSVKVHGQGVFLDKSDLR